MATVGLILVMLCASAASSVRLAPDQAGARKAPLTLVQLQQLISTGVPDGVVAKEVSDRGVREEITREVIDTLRQRGAGPRTIQMLLALLPRATLLLRTTPGAEVSLAGRYLGPVGETGELLRPELEPGRTRLQIRKQHYVPVDKDVDLKHRGTTTLDFPLEWAVGFVRIRVPQPHARISIEGVGQYGGAVENLPVPPGTYRVTASAPSYESRTLDVTVVAGEVATPEIVLVFDQRRLQQYQEGMTDAFAKGHHTRVVQLAREMRELGVLEVDGLALAATSNWELRNYSGFLDMARAVLEQNGEMRLRVIHHHRILIPSHEAVLTVRARGIQFDPADACTVKSFFVAPRAISVRSRTIPGPNNRDFIGLGFEYPNAKNPSKRETVFFIMLDEAQKEALEALLGEAVRLSSS